MYSTMEYIYIEEREREEEKSIVLEYKRVAMETSILKESRAHG